MSSLSPSVLKYLSVSDKVHDAINYYNSPSSSSEFSFVFSSISLSLVTFLITAFFDFAFILTWPSDDESMSMTFLDATAGFPFLKTWSSVDVSESTTVAFCFNFFLPALFGLFGRGAGFSSSSDNSVMGWDRWVFWGCEWAPLFSVSLSIGDWLTVALDI